MTMLKTPYNFVPLSPFVLYPEWAPLASQDHPFADGLSGELAISLTARTPLSVGGKQEPATEQGAGKTYFYRTPEGVPAIPGSTLKGMLRNVLSIAAFGRMHQVEERKFSIRNTKRGTPYYTKIVDVKPRAGWLRFHHGKWQVKTCDYTRLHQQDLIKEFGLDVGEWKKADTVKARYDLLNGLREIQFEVEAHKNKIEGVATAVGGGSVTGTVVVTGQPGTSFDRPKAKKWEFIFYQGPTDDWQPVPELTLQDFLFVHDASEEWAFFQKGGHGQEAIPVFWHGPQVKSMTSMGLAKMYRVAQKNSLHDALRNTSTHHLDDARADLAEMLFGRLRPEDPGAHDWGLKGRVNVGMLEPEGNSFDFSWTRETVLSSPKPSFYPAYIKQNPEASGLALTLDAQSPELRGWKRYPAKPNYVQPPPANIKTNKVKVSLETVAAGSRFVGRIRFHNMRPAELGALLWVLDFGNRNQLSHALGTGKPYGLGQVQVQVDPDESSILPNDRDALSDLTTDQILTASRKVFMSYMDSVWASVSERGGKGWEQSPQVSHLLAMADPEEGGRNADFLTYFDGPDDFTKVKNMGEVLALYSDTPEAVDWVVNPKNSLSSYDCDKDLGNALVEAEEEKRGQEEKLRLEKERAAMKPGDAVLSQIVEKIGGDMSGKTLQSDVEKLIRSILDMHAEDQPNAEDAESVLSDVESRNIKKLNKACKKVRNFLSQED